MSDVVPDPVVDLLQQIADSLSRSESRLAAGGANPLSVRAEEARTVVRTPTGEELAAFGLGPSARDEAERYARAIWQEYLKAFPVEARRLRDPGSSTSEVIERAGVEAAEPDLPEPAAPPSSRRSRRRPLEAPEPPPPAMGASPFEVANLGPGQGFAVFDAAGRYAGVRTTKSEAAELVEALRGLVGSEPPAPATPAPPAAATPDVYPLGPPPGRTPVVAPIPLAAGPGPGTYPLAGPAPTPPAPQTPGVGSPVPLAPAASPAGTYPLAPPGATPGGLPPTTPGVGAPVPLATGPIPVGQYPLAGPGATPGNPTGAPGGPIPVVPTGPPPATIPLAPPGATPGNPAGPPPSPLGPPAVLPPTPPGAPSSLPNYAYVPRAFQPAAAVADRFTRDGGIVDRAVANLQFAAAGAGMGSVGMALKGAALYGTILMEAGEAAREFAESVHASNRRLAAYSMPVAAAEARLELHDYRRTLEFARSTERSAVDLAESVDRMREAWAGWDRFAANVMNTGGTFGTGFSAAIGGAASAVGDAANAAGAAIGFDWGRGAEALGGAVGDAFTLGVRWWGPWIMGQGWGGGNVPQPGIEIPLNDWVGKFTHAGPIRAPRQVRVPR